MELVLIPMEHPKYEKKWWGINLETPVGTEE